MGTIKYAFYAQPGGRDGSSQRHLTCLWSGKRQAREGLAGLICQGRKAGDIKYEKA